MFDRQIMVFGKHGQELLQQITVGIVGLGGLGSVVFELLVRLGIGKIIIIDHDIVEESNLNRLAASTLADAIKKRTKVSMLKQYAVRINPGTKVIALCKNIHDEGVLNHLKCCDAIFGCTDNQSSRAILNSFVIEHLIPYFDTGTGIEANSAGNIEHAGGQVRVVIPGSGCLNCINGIDLDVAQQEMLPEPERRIAIERGYIRGADVPAPAVASLNGVIANLAVTEFIAFVTGFKPLYRYVFYDFLKAKTIGFNFKKQQDCFTCSDTGSLAKGDSGTALAADMLVDYQKQTQSKGEIKMTTQNTNIIQALTDFVNAVKHSSLEIDADPDGQWFLIKNIRTCTSFNKSKTDIMVKFLEGSNNPVILVPEDLTIEKNNGICPIFIANHTFIKGWKNLCPAMFEDIGDEVFEFVACLVGFMAEPLLCGLMGCDDKGQNNEDVTMQD